MMQPKHTSIAMCVWDGSLCFKSPVMMSRPLPFPFAPQVEQVPTMRWHELINQSQNQSSCDLSPAKTIPRNQHATHPLRLVQASCRRTSSRLPRQPQRQGCVANPCPPDQPWGQPGVRRANPSQVTNVSVRRMSCAHGQMKRDALSK